MRIFCPAMVVGCPLLPAAVVRVSSGAHGEEPLRSHSTWVRSTRSGVSCLTLMPVPGAPAPPRGPWILGNHCARAGDRKPMHNPSRMPYRWPASLTRGGYLLVDLRDLAGTDGPTTLADGELQALLHGDRLD